ncbi:MAG: hypothetical protein IJ594_01015 [Oscillospiraceae bacterium]|nr:hypothetical protein [Oscillospiraceae bacterium]
MSDLSPFCTCGDLQCPFHPSKHDRGCSPCIVKNLKLGEIPNCFFDKAGIKESADYSYQSFARAVVEKG